MNATPRPSLSKLTRRCAAALLLGCTPWLRGQVGLYVQTLTGARLVVAAKEGTPLIQVDGALVSAPTHKYALEKVPEYRPEFVDIQDFRVVNSYVDDGGAGQNRQLEFYGNFVTPYALPHAFFVMDCRTENEGRMIFLREIGNLVPHKKESLLLVVPIRGDIGQTHYYVHVFSEGGELLTSQMTWGAREEVLDAMVAKRTKGAADRGPQPFVGAPPDYPPALRRAKISGRAVVRIHLDERGRPLDPKVVSATDPAFGESALAAIRLWRILPAVRAGRPIPLDVNIPFGFAP